jgi:hypothetical protein
MQRGSRAGGGLVALEEPGPGHGGQGAGRGGGAGQGGAGRGGGGGGGGGGDGEGGGIDDIPQPTPLPPIIPGVTLPPLTPLEAAFVNIGFSEAGARLLASTEGENIPLESLSPMEDKEVKTSCQTM